VVARHFQHLGGCLAGYRFQYVRELRGIPEYFGNGFVSSHFAAGYGDCYFRMGMAIALPVRMFDSGRHDSRPVNDGLIMQ
jgi:hypothetical protein